MNEAVIREDARAAINACFNDSRGRIDTIEQLVRIYGDAMVRAAKVENSMVSLAQAMKQPSEQLFTMYATAIIRLYDLLVRHELKGVKPAQLFIGVTGRAQ